MKRLLTDAKVKNLKPKDKAYRAADGGNLYLLIKPNSSKLWRHDCQINNKRVTLSLGGYPEYSLSEARAWHEQNRNDIEKGIDPREAKKEENQLHLFSYYALETNRILDLKPSTLKKRLERQEKHLFPVFDKKPVTEITAIDVLNLCKDVAENGSLENAHLLATYTRQTFDTLLSMQLVTINPAESIKRLLPKLKRDPDNKNFAHITDPKDLRTLLLSFDNYHGDIAVKQALKLSPLVMLRPQNIRFLKWEYIDFDTKLVSIPSDDMKMGRMHKLPLSNQAIEILRIMEPITIKHEYVFLTAQGLNTGKPMSENTLNAAIQRAKNPETGEKLGKGFTTSHGLRTTASTLLNEMGYNPDVIEMQLAHLDKDRIRRTYNKAELLPERIKMMQEWADFLDSIKLNDNVITFKQKA